MRAWRVPLAPPEIGPEEKRAVARALDSGWLAMGPATAAFEGAFASLAGTPHAIAVSSGTAALHLALHALDLAPGDEVVLPSLTFAATANAVVAAGGVPVFADVTSLDDPCISAQSIEPHLSGRSRAAIAVHFGGMPCEMGPLAALCAARGVALLEDAAHAPGARLDGAPVGSLGRASCFSFYANKNLTTIEGGMIATADAALAERVRRLRTHGLAAFSFERHQGASPDRDIAEPGFNYRMDDLRAALGLAGLERLAARNRRRNRLLDRLRGAIAHRPDLRLAFAQVRPGRQGVAHLAALLAADAPCRAALVRWLEERGIQTSHHYLPAHTLSCYRRPGPPLPVTEEFARRELTLPLAAALSDAQVDEVADALAAWPG